MTVLERRPPLEAPRETGWSRSLQSLARLPGLPQTAATVLMVSLPLWLYAILAAGITLEVNNDSSAIEIARFVAGRLTLFPLLFATYVLAVRLPNRYPGTLRFWAIQLSVSAVFLTLMYPLLLLLNYWAFDVPPVQVDFLDAALHGDFKAALAPFRLWGLWVATSLELSEIYLLGLALILALNSFLRYRTEQSLRAELHTKWLEAQLSTLREQIGPHFLFNALNTILASIRDEPEVAERMTVELGALLRHNLDRGDQEFSSVADEIQFMERYLAVMKMRFETRLQISAEIDPATHGYRIPAFLLLPLVENAVKHGVARTPGVSRIEIRGELRDRELHFRFLNSAERPAAPPEVREHRPIGLENMRSRILNLYGAAGSFTAGFDEAGRWAATIVIPAQRA